MVLSSLSQPFTLRSDEREGEGGGGGVKVYRYRVGRSGGRLWGAGGISFSLAHVHEDLFPPLPVSLPPAPSPLLLPPFNEEWFSDLMEI